MGELQPKDVLEVGLKALFGPVHEIFIKLTGPAAESYGLMWSESIDLRRQKRLIKGLVEVKKMVDEADFDPQMVPDKLLLPIFEGMSLEDDEDLYTMWAALLANAANPANNEKVRPGFVAMLKQMSAEEAKLLGWMYDTLFLEFVVQTSTQAFLINPKVPNAYNNLTSGLSEALDQSLPVTSAKLVDVYKQITAGRGNKKECYVSIDGLLSAQVIAKHQNEEKNMETDFYVTARGLAFVEACRTPKPKS